MATAHISCTHADQPLVTIRHIFIWLSDYPTYQQRYDVGMHHMSVIRDGYKVPLTQWMTVFGPAQVLFIEFSQDTQKYQIFALCNGVKNYL